MNNNEINKYIATLKKTPNVSWKHLATIVNTKCNTTFTSDSIRKRYNSGDAYKIRLATNQESLLNQECDKAGIPIEDVKHYWYKSEMFSINAQGSRMTPEQVRDFLTEELKDHSPKYPTLKRTKSKDPHLLVIDIADLHIGKLALEGETGDEYNMEIACQRAKTGVRKLLHKSKGFDTEKILFVVGNDILHIDNVEGKTTRGTHQDTDGKWWQMFSTAQKLYIEIIEELTSVADVHVMHCPSNHDFTAGWYLAQTLQAWFRKAKNITFNISIKHRKYFLYGKNLIGLTHGDGAKWTDLPQLMAKEAREDWSKADYGYIYTHHRHHKERLSKDLIGVTIECLRSPSGHDAWHAKGGYVNKQAIECFIHHKEDLQIARFTEWY